MRSKSIEAIVPDEAPAEADPDRHNRRPMRAGGRRLEAFHAQDYYVSYQADPSLRMPDLDRALAGRKIGARVHPFVQHRSAADDGGFDVARGGEVVAVAIARQMSAIGWVVGLVPTPAVLQKARAEFPEADLSAVLARLTVTGEVSFRVSTTRRDGQPVHVARIEAPVRFLADRPDTQTEIFACTLAATAEVTRQQVAGRTARARQAAQAALRQFVRRLFTDRRLVQALVDEVRRR